MKKQLVLGLILIVAASVGFYFIKKRTPISENEFYKRNPHLSKPVKAELPPAERTTPEFQKGDYQLKPNKAFPVAFDFRQQLKTQEQIVFGMSNVGVLVFHSLGWDGSRLAVLAEIYLKNLSLTPDRPEVTKKLKDLTKRGAFDGKTPDMKDVLTYGVVLMIDPKGRIKEVRGTDSTSLIMASEVFFKARSILRPVPGLEAGKIGATEWDEADRSFKVNYDVRKENDFFHFKGVMALDAKTGNLLGNAPAQSTQAFLKSSEASLDWDWAISKSLPQTQKFIFNETFKMDGKTVIESSSSANYGWQESSESTLNMDILSRFNRSIPLRDLFRFQQVSQNESLAKTKDRFMTWNEVRANFSRVDSPKTLEIDREKVLIEMSNAIVEDPNLLPEIANYAMSAPDNSRQLTIALGALGYAGTPAAQAAMINVFKRADVGQDAREKILAEMAIHNLPLTDESKNFLKETNQKSKDVDLSKSALLTLGASLGRDGDSKTTEYILESYDKAAKGENQESVRLAIGAMGNSKSNIFNDQIKEVIGAKDENTRSEAVMALRFSQDEEGRQLLEKQFTDDSAHVRMTAAQAMAYQPFDEKTKSSLKVCTKDSDSGVKTECYRVLASKTADPDVESFLSSAVGSESDSEAKRFLENWSKGQLEEDAQ